MIIPCSWIFGVLMYIPWFLALNFVKEMGECRDMWPAKWMGKAYSITWFLFGSFCPISLMAALYIRVVYTLWFKRGEASQQQVGNKPLQWQKANFFFPFVHFFHIMDTICAWINSKRYTYYERLELILCFHCLPERARCAYLFFQ